ncbi:MAG: hypothetical protein KDE27_13945 [Planctomycetes bacterium]|nr:hypothetical protein [Planctomycetota bacterium]
MIRSLPFRSLLAAAALTAVCELPAQFARKVESAAPAPEAPTAPEPEIAVAEENQVLVLPTVLPQGKEAKKLQKQLRGAIELLRDDDASEDARKKAVGMIKEVLGQIESGDSVVAKVHGVDGEGLVHLLKSAKGLEAKAAIEHDHALRLLEVAKADHPLARRLALIEKADGDSHPFAVAKAELEVAKAARAKVLDGDMAKVRKAMAKAKAELEVAKADSKSPMRRRLALVAPEAPVAPAPAVGGDADIAKAINGVRDELRAIRKLMERAHGTMDGADVSRMRVRAPRAFSATPFGVEGFAPSGGRWVYRFEKADGDDDDGEGEHEVHEVHSKKDNKKTGFWFDVDDGKDGKKTGIWVDVGVDTAKKDDGIWVDVKPEIRKTIHFAPGDHGTAHFPEGVHMWRFEAKEGEDEGDEGEEIQVLEFIERAQEQAEKAKAKAEKARNDAEKARDAAEQRKKRVERRRANIR